MATRTWRRAWWTDDPAVTPCELGCGCPVQRTPNGGLADGMRLHVATVHTGARPASVNAPKVGAS